MFTILLSARKYGEEKLVDRCWEMIEKQTEAAVKSESFALIDRPLLEGIPLTSRKWNCLKVWYSGQTRKWQGEA